MNDKDDIERKRNRGGSIEIGNAEDGAITETFPLGGKMLIIKERAIYEMIMADDIDPDRLNPHVPSSSQRLIVKLGTESEILCRTLLTAKRLFKPENIIPSIDTTQLLFVTLEIVQELAALDEEIKDYLAIEKEESDQYEERKNNGLDHAVPSIPDLKTRCKTIFQKVDQAYQAMLAIIRMFYPEFSQQLYYSQFVEFITKKYGEEDMFTTFLKEALPFILIARNIRNCLDHRRTETEIKDFDLQSDLNIISPTIKINYLGSNLDRVSLSQFLPSVPANLLTIFENLMPQLCVKNLNPNRMLQSQVRIIPKELRRNKFIKFAYWLPIGEEGFYQQ